MINSLSRAETWRELRRTIASVRQFPGRFPLRLAEWVRGTYRAELYADAVRRVTPPPTVCYHYWFTPESLGSHYALEQMPAGDRVPVVVRAHGGDLYEYIQPSHHFAYRCEIMDRLDLLCPVSDFGRDYLADRYPTNAGKIVTQRLGVRGRGSINPQPADGLTVLSLANVIRIKRLDRIVDGLALLATEMPNLPIRWILAGDGELMAELRAQVGRLPANVHVDLLGRRPNDAIFELFRDVPIDCLVNASESEGLPVSIMEAFSAAIPAIGPDVGGIAEILRGGGGVLLGSAPTPADHHAAFKVFVDKARTAPMRQAAYRTWYTQYQAENTFTAFASHLIGLSVPDDSPQTQVRSREVAHEPKTSAW